MVSRSPFTAGPLSVAVFVSGAATGRRSALADLLQKSLQHAAALHDIGRVRYESVTDDEALAAFAALSRLEGIIPALETAHALAWVRRTRWPANHTVLVCLSGRGDKDVAHVAQQMEQHA